MWDGRGSCTPTRKWVPRLCLALWALLDATYLVAICTKFIELHSYCCVLRDWEYPELWDVRGSTPGCRCVLRLCPVRQALFGAMIGWQSTQHSLSSIHIAVFCGIGSIRNCRMSAGRAHRPADVCRGSDQSRGPCLLQSIW